MIDDEALKRIVNAYESELNAYSDVNYFQQSIEIKKSEDDSIRAMTTGIYAGFDVTEGIGPIELEGTDINLPTSFYRHKCFYLIENYHEAALDIAIQTDGVEVIDELDLDDPCLSDFIFASLMELFSVHAHLNDLEKQIVLDTYTKNGKANVAERIKAIIFSQ